MRIIFFLVFLSLGCSKSYEHDPNKYFKKTEIDILMTNIVTYVYKLPSKATLKTRFSPIYVDYYRSVLHKFVFDSYYFSSKDGYHYFLIDRPAGNDLKYKRTVGGRFKLRKGDFKPYQFEEIFNSPRLTDSVRIERGRFLFKELIKKGNVNQYLSMKHYIEWPDSSLVYDLKTNAWINPNSLGK
jgi:hypothetical protein